jgi:hypothetical protein
LQPSTKKSKKNTENVTSVPHHAIGGKRVVAPLQPDRLTRFRKHVALEVHITTQDEIPIEATSEVLAADTQAKIPIQASSEVCAADTQAKIPIQASSEVCATDAQKIPIQASSEVHASNTEDGTTLTVHTQEG